MDSFEMHVQQGDIHQALGRVIPGDCISGFYILQSAAIKTTASGRPFFSGTVSDKTGSVSVICWDYSGPVGAGDEGRVVCLAGQVIDYRGTLQITAEQLRLSRTSDPVELSDLVPAAPICREEMYCGILKLVDSMKDPDYQAVCRTFLQRHGDALRTIPAAKSVHHSFLNGLLMHTGNMLKIADHLAGLYSQVINRDLLLTGTLLHDFSKREEFTFSELGLVSGYSVKGQLLGHLVMVSQEAGQIGAQLQVPEEKIVLLQHMLLSHHGKPEYGAAVIPQCAESDLLSLIDMLDSRMEIYRENLENTPMGQFTGRIFALDGHRAYRHYAPEAEE